MNLSIRVSSFSKQILAVKGISKMTLSNDLMSLLINNKVETNSDVLNDMMEIEVGRNYVSKIGEFAGMNLHWYHYQMMNSVEHTEQLGYSVSKSF